MKKICIITCLYFCLTSSAYAYLDPGTGSVILSALVAGIVAIKSYWFLIINKVKSLFKRKNIQEEKKKIFKNW